MINTLILKITGDIKDNDEKIQQAAQELKRGGLVAFPTETVYGLGGNGLDPDAVDKIYKAKGRPSDNPMILHISHREDINSLVSEIPSIAEKLIVAFWPGPLTLIFNKSAIVPEKVTGGLNTVGIRMPAHPIAKRLIEQAGTPIAAPSANLSGKPSPTKAEHVIQDLMGRVEIILEEKPSIIGLESTVLDITADIPVILRPGAITFQQIKEVIGKVEIDQGILEDMKEHMKPKAPGMKYTHYAPDASMTIIQGSMDQVIKKINEMAEQYSIQGKKIGILTTQENINYYPKGMVLSLGSRDKPATIAANLFHILRQFDKKKVDIILAEGIEGQGIEMAIINRMNKAAGHKVIKLSP